MDWTAAANQTEGSEMDAVEWFLVVLGVACMGLFGLVIAASIAEEKQWAQFSKSHDCKVTAKVRGDVVVGTGVGFGSKGAVPIMTTSSTPDKTAYLCNDGITYWR